jgi:hypothetical protein
MNNNKKKYKENPKNKNKKIKSPVSYALPNF